MTQRKGRHFLRRAPQCCGPCSEQRGCSLRLPQEQGRSTCECNRLLATDLSGFWTRPSSSESYARPHCLAPLPPPLPPARPHASLKETDFPRIRKRSPNARWAPGKGRQAPSWPRPRGSEEGGAGPDRSGSAPRWARWARDRVSPTEDPQQSCLPSAGRRPLCCSRPLLLLGRENVPAAPRPGWRPLRFPLGSPTAASSKLCEGASPVKAIPAHARIESVAPLCPRGPLASARAPG